MRPIFLKNQKHTGNKSLVVKVIGLFASVRIYNLAAIALAQLLAAVFIMAPGRDALSLVVDYKLWLLILASAATVASGYIINNFYDHEKDLINRPQKTILENKVSQTTQWSVYFVLNGVGFMLAWLVSWRAMAFFTGYAFVMWLYSHKLKRVLYLGNLMSALLSIMPFFALFAYYKNFYPVIFVHGSFLFIMLTMHTLVKDLENLKGDLVQNYRTIPAVLGEKTAKNFYTLLTMLSLAPISALILYFNTGYMDYYFTFILGALLVCLPLLWTSGRKREYLLIHFILKAIIVGGVFSILLIDPPAIGIRLQDLLG